MAELVLSFLSYASAGLDELRRGIAAADGAVVARTCHRLQGCSSNLGASTMAQMFAELEVAAVGSTLQGAPDILRRLEEELARVQPELTAAFPHGPSSTTVGLDAMHRVAAASRSISRLPSTPKRLAAPSAASLGSALPELSPSRLPPVSDQ